ncbi:MAG: bifunctional homocysteine S-methyltransferase/methylenetetrahydrofolate reductase [Sedimentisphaerales bacterium]|nr:bifunctional homocysteine S-methyltransferase/methylenetetrahydrofolate reductase [Sedimentisphaerales bacterium]
MARPNLLELVHNRVAFADGAMGTMLFQHGVFLNTCFDELNLTNPKLVAQVHTDYLNAGSDFIETNTFGANEFKLAKYGLADKVTLINSAGARIARDCAGGNALVAGSVGPLGIEHIGLGTTVDEQAHRAFAHQIKALIDADVDFLILETFTNPAELLLAIKTATEQTNLPIIAQMVANELNQTLLGGPIEEAITRIAVEPAVSIVGLNCSVGPSAMLESLKLIRSVTDKPISVQPNAGLPRDVEGRRIYMCTPEYMAEFAKRFFENGARIIGGCCGTTPEHIRQIVKAVSAMDKAMEQQAIRPKITIKTVEQTQGLEPIPLSQKSRIGAKLAAEQRFCSIELVPPRGINLAGIEEKVRTCADYGIDAINIPDGPRATSRLSPMVTAVKVQQAANIEAILHVCCRDKNIIGMQSDMLGTEAMGVKNVLLITGDPPKLGEYPDATAVFDLDAIALTTVVHNLNRGLDIAGNELSEPLSLTIGVGANPVASDLDREIYRFRRKAAAGAEYAITQPVFDVKMLLDFIDAVADTSIPIVAGIWPFTSYKNAEFMANEVPGVVVPDALLHRMSAAKTREQGRALGVQIAREMIEQVTNRVAGFVVSAPFGNVRIALAALSKITAEEI